MNDNLLVLHYVVFLQHFLSVHLQKHPPLERKEEKNGHLVLIDDHPLDVNYLNECLLG